MKKSEIVDLFTQILTENGPKKSPKALALALLEAFCHGAAQALAAGDEVVLPGVGKIKPKTVAAKPARNGRNPRTGEAIQVEAKAAYKSIKVKPAKEMLALLNA